MELTVGPNQFFWPAATWRDFYARIADEAPVERVVLGELVCSKRLPHYQSEIHPALERLKRAGKTVLMTSLALITLKRERRLAEELADQDLLIEVNDLTQIAYLPPEQHFAVGPLANVYNESSLHWLAQRGAQRVCLPPELPVSSIGIIASEAQRLGVAIEVWGFGRLPLAISGRCYHARLHGRTKDTCQFVCGEDADGLAVNTLDEQEFLAINGVQTLSHSYAMYAHQSALLRAAGVSALRLSPHSGNFVDLAKAFRKALDGDIAPGELNATLAALMPDRRFASGYLTGRPGWDNSMGSGT